MPLFKIERGNALQQIEEIPFKLEKELQTLCENNLIQIFELTFVKSEFLIHNFRIDTLAFDEQIKSFVIIEYKRDRNFSVVDQGLAYLSLMLNNKAEFILEYNEYCEKNLKRNDIDWSQSKVIFISPTFTEYQRESINFKDLPIELWEIKRYSNQTIQFVNIKPSGATESIKTISEEGEVIRKVSKEIKVYKEEDHLEGIPDEIKELYSKFKNAILNIADGIVVKPTKWYIGFKAKTNFTDIHIQKKALKMWINLFQDELDDPRQLVKDVTNIGHWGNGDYEIQIKDDENLEYIISLVKQSYRKNK